MRVKYFRTLDHFLKELKDFKIHLFLALKFFYSHDNDVIKIMVNLIEFSILIFDEKYDFKLHSDGQYFYHANNRELDTFR